MGNFFPDEIIEEVKDRNDIVDVISGYISVKTTGGSHKALCPFHREKTPSFVINAEKQIYKCFGCGVGGDVIHFVMKIENLDFIDSIKVLAQRANIHIEENNISNEEKRELQKKVELYEINKEAGRFFYLNLIKSGKLALEYLEKRGLTSQIIKSFGLGYSLNNWEDLLNHLLKLGYDEKTINISGLIIARKDKSGYYDRFRNRIMYPIFDTRGNVIGFGGRVLDNSLPKYLNSPETPIFNKSNTLYGLNIARKNITDGKIIIVEGYMDVIALHQHGFKNCVASLGTSLTKGHALLLKKYCQEVIVCFDGDEAGTNATIRSLDVLEEAGLIPKVLVLPNNLDPDDFINQDGKFQFKEQLQSAIGLIDYKLLLAKKKHDLNSSEGRIGFVKELASVMKDIKSPVEREVYIQKIEKETGVSKETIQLEIYGNRSPKPFEKNQKYTSKNKRDNKYIDAINPVEQKGHIIAEKQLIKAMIINKELVPLFASKVNLEEFSIAEYQMIFEYLLSNNDKIYSIESLLNEHPQLQEIIKDILKTDIEHINIEKALEKYIINLRRYKLLYQIRILQQQQNDLLKEKKLNKEEVEKELLKIGVEIMRLNTEIQKLQL
ncbi:DNA primase [Alkaliphilus peptidifermentans]|uniref:DNA primase n=1 Tax=Alkaliphilus peptidifermentans DSM 18978 TaxID=1120976 RepID=A0A1G5BNR2_9FIRM|nr:DNA primase [Alkaliphilus peptidifermentans]SCX91885.1 DNA primase [Alkaliphilus peptidifermentans DSM 18978]